MRGAPLLAWVLMSGCVTAGLTLDDTRRDELLFGEIPPGGWHEVEAPGFTLRSDVSPEQLQEAAQTIAQARRALHAVLTEPKEPRTVHVVLYANRFEFEARHGQLESDVEGDTLYFSVPLHEALVLDAFAQLRITDALPYRPHWLAVGLAADVAALRWQSPNSVQLGAPNPRMYAAFLSSRSVSVKQLRSWFGDDDPQLALSGLSWALARWAQSEQPQRFRAYLKLLAQGDPERAWAQTFAPLESRLDVDVYRFISNGRYDARLRFVPDSPHVPVTVRVVAPP